MKPEVWENYKRRTKRWGIRTVFELLHSKAFSSIRYAPTIKVLFWSFEKRKVEKTNKRGRNKFFEKEEPFSFTYGEAERRELTRKEFHRAIKELIEKGFWDLEKSGSGLQGDFSLYRFSTRWINFGNQDFEKRSLPRKVSYGCFGRVKDRQKQGPISALDQGPKTALENIPQGPISAPGNRVL